MHKEIKSLIYCSICFGFSGYYLILQTFYGDRPNENTISSYKILKPIVLPYLNQLTINPFDYYFSRLENYLIAISYFFALWFFADVVILAFKTKYPECKNNTKSIYIMRFKEYMKKIRGRKK